MHRQRALLSALGLVVSCWLLAASPGLAQSPTPTPSPSAAPAPAPTPTDPVGESEAQPVPSPQAKARPRPVPSPSPAPPSPQTDSRGGTSGKRVNAAADPPVSVVDNAFEPRDLSIAAGDAVTWTNEGEFVHTVTSDDGLFESGMLDPGETFTFTFSEAGTYPYYCAIHGGPGGSGMAGTIVVTAAPAQEDDGAADPATVPSPGDLPATGGSLGLAVIGFAAVAAGSILLFIARR